MSGRLNRTGEVETGYGDEGNAARFFYCAKANDKDRNEGVEDKNTHPTVKPTELMRYLVRLVTPKGGLVLDPFMGSGSTGKACMLEGCEFVGVDNDETCIPLATQRIDAVL
jgi:DNA modification methylase